MKSALLLMLALSAQAGDLGGHEPAAAEPALATEDRAAVLQEMWARRILAPDLTSWAPADAQLLGQIRMGESDAFAYLKKKFGGIRPWTAPRRAKDAGPRLLTKEGYEKYLFHLTQDAIDYFEKRGAGAKWALKLTDWDGRRLFDGDGRVSPVGGNGDTRAQLKLETDWWAPHGEIFGTRRPPK
ncbi:MAG: hypothetical protein Q7J64_03945 [Elusimicrobiota bacterium]|nr:hypothetical protein [Elusimicrobiota bacterium]